MKFETIYRKSRDSINKSSHQFDLWTKSSYEYELALFNNFVLRLVDPIEDEYYIKAQRWCVQQNGITRREHGRQHIKQILRHIYDDCRSGSVAHN